MLYNIAVAPFVGAWIEIGEQFANVTQSDVAPFVGAWIEMKELRLNDIWTSVAPFVGAWIEIIMSQGMQNGKRRRSLRGSVD